MEPFSPQFFLQSFLLVFSTYHRFIAYEIQMEKKKLKNFALKFIFLLLNCKIRWNFFHKNTQMKVAQIVLNVEKKLSNNIIKIFILLQRFFQKVAFDKLFHRCSRQRESIQSCFRQIGNILFLPSLKNFCCILRQSNAVLDKMLGT